MIITYGCANKKPLSLNDDRDYFIAHYTVYNIKDASPDAMVNIIYINVIANARPFFATPLVQMLMRFNNSLYLLRYLEMWLD